MYSCDQRPLADFTHEPIQRGYQIYYLSLYIVHQPYENGMLENTPLSLPFSAAQPQTSDERKNTLTRDLMEMFYFIKCYIYINIFY